MMLCGLSCVPGIAKNQPELNFQNALPHGSRGVIEETPKTIPKTKSPPTLIPCAPEFILIRTPKLGSASVTFQDLGEELGRP